MIRYVHIFSSYPSVAPLSCLGLYYHKQMRGSTDLKLNTDFSISPHKHEYAAWLCLGYGCEL